MKKPLLWLTAGVMLAASGAQADETVVPRFDLKRIILDGNSLLPTDDVAAILKKYTGPQKDFGTLQEAMDALEAAYRRRGYTMITVILPEQELERGEVRLQAIESKVRQITVQGNTYFSRENILAALPTLKRGESPKIADISENLRAANENPAKKLTLQFKSPDKPEELDAQLQVNDQKPWKIALTGDNTGTAQSGYYRMGLMLEYANLWNLDHVAALQYTTSPDHADKVKIISGSYRIPLYRWGDTIDLFGGYSDVDNGNYPIPNTQYNLGISGKGIVSGLRYNLGLPRAGAYEHKLSLGMDYRQYENKSLLSGVDLAADVLAHPFSVTYGGSWNSDLVSFDGYLGVLHNEPWGGLGQQRNFDQIRTDAKANYWIFRYGFNKMVRPGKDWIFRVAGNGQYTPDRLVPGEQFGLGGSSSVRGYEEREEGYDAGFTGNAEVYSPDLAGLLKIPKTQLRLLGFFDGGTGYNLRVQSSEVMTDNTLIGTGGGFRLALGEFFSFSLDWGYALRAAANTRKGGNAVHFKGQLSF